MRYDLFKRISFMVPMLLVTSIARAQATYTPEELHRHFQNVADAYDMRSGGARLTLRSQPLMHWQNPERNHELGSTYIWEKDGVPQVLVSIFTFEYNNVVRCRHEMISLAEGAFDCTLHSESVWTPKRPGLDWIGCP